MKITVIGSGYVGLVSGICFAKLGHEVVCIDKDKTKIAKLQNGEIPIFEPNLKELLEEVVQDNKISFSTNLNDGLNNCNVVFIAVGTPQDEDGSADLSYVLDAAAEIAQLSDSYKLIVTKSTVPAKTGQKIKELVAKTNPNCEFDIASNPEFLREGMAINDFMNPDRIVIGVENQKSQQILSEIYAKFAPEKLVFSDIITAELIKYASNSFLATKISFINEMADLCEVVGGNIKELSQALGMDLRIGSKFLNPGPGFGGSCFPKDIMAISNFARESKTDLSIIEAVVNSNANRKQKMAMKVTKNLGGDVTNKKIALLGLAFKANTDDIRYSPAIALAQDLAKKGANIIAHDPQAIANSKRQLANIKNIEFCDDKYQAIRDADAIVIATEWQEYRDIDWNMVKNLTKSRKIIDLRNLFNLKEMQQLGFQYSFVGFLDKQAV